MVGLKEYLILAVALAVVMGVLGALSHPDFAAEARSALGVISLFALMAPLIPLVSSGVELPSFDDFTVPEYGDGYTEVAADAYEEGLRCAIAERLSISEEAVSVSLTDIDIASMRAREISVTLGGEAALSDTRSMREWIKESFLLEGGICEVVINFE